jgi:hypothetical protein
MPGRCWPRAAAGTTPSPLAAAIETTLARLRTLDTSAVDLLHLVAVLAPDPIPLAWLHVAPQGTLTEDLHAVVTRRLPLRRALGRLADLGLARPCQDTLQVHRLTQAVLRDQRSPDQLTADRERATRLVGAAEPDDSGTDPASWPAWAALLPHLLALDPAKASPTVRETACNALWYLIQRGEYQAVLPLAQAWHAEWRHSEGSDSRHTLQVASHLALALRYLGRHREAYAIDQDILDRRSRVLGPDHPDTLTTATA